MPPRVGWTRSPERVSMSEMSRTTRVPRKGAAAEKLRRSARSALSWVAWLALWVEIVLGLAAPAAAHGGVASGVPVASGPVVRSGELRHASEVLGPRAQLVLVASTPLLERAPAVPASPFWLDAAQRYDGGFAYLQPLDPAHSVVIRWRRHVPRMDSGDPPSSAALAS